MSDKLGLSGGSAGPDFSEGAPNPEEKKKSMGESGHVTPLPYEGGGGAQAPAEPIGNRALSGAAWSIGANLAAKVFTAVGQFVLVWFLAPDDFAVMGIAFGINGIAILLCDNGLRQVLIQRSGDESQLLSDGFWTALALNVVASTVLLASGPVAAHYYGRNDYLLVMALMALAALLQTLHIAPAARLYRALRFRSIALCGLVEGVTYIGGAILLAYLGWGPLALIIPHVARTCLAIVVLRVLAGNPPVRAPQWSRCKELLRDARWLNLDAMLNALQGSGANLVLGALASETVTGLFIWGYAVAAQVVFVLARNLQNVFFPALTRLKDEPERQYEGFRKGLRALLAVVAPLCVLQAFVAGPLLELVAPGRWSGAGTVIFWISLGLAFEPVYVLASALLLAQGRFRWVAGRTGLMVALLLLAAGLSAGSDDAERIAQAVGAALALGALLAGRLAVSSAGKGWSELLRMIAPPVAATALAGLAALGVQAVFADANPRFALGASVVALAAVYGLLGWFLLKSDLLDLATRIRRKPCVES